MIAPEKTPTLWLVPRASGAAALGAESSSSEVPVPSQLSVESIYREHAASVFRMAARLLGQDAELEDIVHEVFLVVQRRLGDFRGEASVNTWLVGITIRVVAGYRRRRWWRWRNALQGPVPDQRDGVLRATPDTVVEPERELERRRQTRMLYEALERIDEKYRTALILFELEGWPAEKIARTTGTTVENVWIRLRRGRDKLYRALAVRKGKVAP